MKELTACVHFQLKHTVLRCYYISEALCFVLDASPGSPLRFNLCAFAPLRHARIATRSVAGGSLREIFSLASFQVTKLLRL